MPFSLGLAWVTVKGGELTQKVGPRCREKLAKPSDVGEVFIFELPQATPVREHFRFQKYNTYGWCFTSKNHAFIQ